MLPFKGSRHYWRDFLDALYPSSCLQCSQLIESGEVLCMRCEETIPPTADLLVPISQGRTLTVEACASYEGVLRRMLVEKHSSDRSSLVGLARLMVRRLGMYHKQNPIGCFVPTPLHWSRLMWRGYNQAEILAQECGRLLGVPVLNCLARVRPTGYQAECRTVRDRQRNVKDAFVLKPHYIQKIRELSPDKTVAFVDDIVTTGATLREMSQALLNVRSLLDVRGFVICRGGS